MLSITKTLHHEQDKTTTVIEEQIEVQEKKSSEQAKRQGCLLEPRWRDTRDPFPDLSRYALS
jgi:hypothetical protein